MTVPAIEVDHAYRRCEEITRQQAANFYYGIRLLPRGKRHAMSAVYARRVDDIGDGNLQANQQLAALAAGRETLAAVAEDRADPRDPVAVALANARLHYRLPLDALELLIEGVELDVLGTRYETFEELVGYCRRVAGSIGRLCLAIFADGHAAAANGAAALADDLGVAMQLTNILRDVREDRDRGRVYLPAEDLRRFGCAEDKPPTAELIRYEAARATEWFERGLRLVELLDARSASCVLAMSGIYRGILERIAREPATVLQQRISLPVWEKAWVALRSLASEARARGPVAAVGEWRGAVSGRRAATVSANCGDAVSGRRVAVVGGGLAGITAALDCAGAGATVTLLESRGRLGGAAYSFTREGVHADNGQHVFLRCCTAYQELLERLDARDAVTMQDRLEIAVLAPDGRRGRLRRSGLPAPLHLAGALLRYPFLTPRERASVAWAMQRLGKVDPDDPAAERRSFGDWLREHRQSPDALETVWSLIARPTLNLTLDAASLAQAAQVFQLGLLGDATAGDIGHARVPLSDIHDQAARRALAQAGVNVRLRRGATMIVPGAGGYCVEINGAPTIEAEAVVLAVPPERATRLLPPEAGLNRGAFMRLGRSPIVNLHVVYDRAVLDVPFAAGVHTPVQWVFDRTESAGVTAGQYLVVSLSAADDELTATADELRAKYLPALADLLVAAREASVTAFFVTREHSATFRAGPGARALRPGPHTELPGLVLAGSWTDTGWPATMEGAVRSGHAAAREVLGAALRRPAVAAEAQLAGGRA